MRSNRSSFLLCDGLRYTRIEGQRVIHLTFIDGGDDDDVFSLFDRILAILAYGRTYINPKIRNRRNETQIKCMLNEEKHHNIAEK